MQWPKNWSQVLYLFPATRDPVFVAIEAGDIQAVRAADVQGNLIVEVPQVGPLRGSDNRRKLEFVAHHAHERKRNSIGIGETQIGKALADLIAPFPGFRAMRL